MLMERGEEAETGGMDRGMFGRSEGHSSANAEQELRRKMMDQGQDEVGGGGDEPAGAINFETDLLDSGNRKSNRADFA